MGRYNLLRIHTHTHARNQKKWKCAKLFKCDNFENISLNGQHSQTETEERNRVNYLYLMHPEQKIKKPVITVEENVRTKSFLVRCGSFVQFVERD